MAGWQLSHRGNLTQWIGPLVGFILPCLAFCLNIPRKRKLSIPPWVFSPSPDRLLDFLLGPYYSGTHCLAIGALIPLKG